MQQSLYKVMKIDIPAICIQRSASDCVDSVSACSHGGLICSEYRVRTDLFGVRSLRCDINCFCPEIVHLSGSGSAFFVNVFDSRIINRYVF